PGRPRNRPDRAGLAPVRAAAPAVARPDGGARPRRTLPRRHLAAAAPDLPDARPARQLPPWGAGPGAPGLHRLSPPDDPLLVLSGQPGRPEGPSGGAAQEGARTPPAVLRIQRRVAARLPRRQEMMDSCAPGLLTSRAGADF